MEVFTITLIAAVLASFGGKDTRIVADLSAKLGAGPGLVFVSLVSVIVSSAAMAWLGAELADGLIGSPRAYLIAGTLVAAAAMLLMSVTITPPKEPTRSHGAIGIVLLSRQIIDAPRLLIFASAAAKATFLLSFAGGALGSAFALLGAIWAARWSRAARHTLLVRRAMALSLGALAVAIALIPQGLIL